MPVVVCPSCKSRMTVLDAMFGKKGRCPSCGVVFQLPALVTVPTTLYPGPPVQPLEVPETPPRPPSSLRKSLLIGGGVGIAALVLLVVTLSSGGNPKSAESRSEAKGEHEEKVKRYVVAMKGGQVVTFLRWGPHLSQGEVAAMCKEVGLEKSIERAASILADTLIRVRYRIGEREEDFIYSVFNGEVYLIRAAEGDDWPKHFKEELKESAAEQKSRKDKPGNPPPFLPGKK